MNQQPQQLNIAIVGAGIAGLTAAIALRIHGQSNHTVTLFERYAEPKPIGGPVSIEPNATRLLISLGLRDEIERHVPKLRSVLNAYSYKDGTHLASMPAESLHDIFGYPIWNISRFQLVQILWKHAQSLGIVFCFQSEISAVSDEAGYARIETSDGSILKYDLVIGADGIRSAVRASILGEQIAVANPLTAYNVNVPRSRMAADPDLEPFLLHSGGWFGPNRFIMLMDMPDFNDWCNMCLVSERPDGKEGEWFVKGDMDSVKSQFIDFEPRIQKLLAMADPDSCYLWSLSDLAVLKTWHSDNGRLVIIGDAAHAVLPYAGTGASFAIEDALCLAECLTQVKSLRAGQELRPLMQAFEAIRKPRAAFATEMARINMRSSHLPDGPEQEARDFALLKRKMGGSAHLQPRSEGSVHKTALEELEAPTDVRQSLKADGRKYIMNYDVVEHTRQYLSRLD